MIALFKNVTICAREHIASGENLPSPVPEVTLDSTAHETALKYSESRATSEKFASFAAKGSFEHFQRYVTVIALVQGVFASNLPPLMIPFFAAQRAAPLEIPTSTPSFLANALPVAKASSFSTVMISSYISVLSVSGTKPAQIP